MYQYPANTNAKMRTAMRASPYQAIVAWGVSLGSFGYYVEAQQAAAAKAGAPHDALFERDGKWTCVSDLAPGHHFHAYYAAHLAARG